LVACVGHIARLVVTTSFVVEILDVFVGLLDELDEGVARFALVFVKPVGKGCSALASGAVTVVKLWDSVVVLVRVLCEVEMVVLAGEEGP